MRVGTRSAREEAGSAGSGGRFGLLVFPGEFVCWCIRMDYDVGFVVVAGEKVVKLRGEAVVFIADEIGVMLLGGKLGFEGLVVDHVVDGGSDRHFLPGEAAGAGAHETGVEDCWQAGSDARGAEGEGFGEEVLGNFPGVGRIFWIVVQEGRHAVMENEGLVAQGSWMDDGVRSAAKGTGEPGGVGEDAGVWKAASWVEEEAEGWLDRGWRRVG